VVIGGAQSNNTHELVKTCSQSCARVHHVQAADDLCPLWFGPDDTVGLTAGTSTPDSVIEEIERSLLQISRQRSQQDTETLKVSP
jgi:4-hydroxy-3-methylbut-2-enyl diphosphate reductase